MLQNLTKAFHDYTCPTLAEQRFIVRAAGAGVWQQVQQGENCLLAEKPTKISRTPCANATDVETFESIQQQWRVVEFANVAWQAVESLAYPGLCVTLDANAEPAMACSCGQLALLVCTFAAELEVALTCCCAAHPQSCSQLHCYTDRNCK